MAIRLPRSSAASFLSSSPFFWSVIQRSLENISPAVSGCELSRAVRVAAFSSSSSSFSFPEASAAPPTRREKKITERLSACFDAVNDRKLPPEPRWLRNSIRQFSSDTKRVNTKVNFSLSDDSDEDEENSPGAKETGRPNLPPPYDPFSKKAAIEEPEDPKDLQAVFHKMRTDGFTNEAVKMFDALSKDGLTHEALELFSQIKDKGHMPDVVAHTAVVEAYANAGQPKEALKVFLRMLACGVAPNAYSYTVLIRGLVLDAKTLGDAKKYLLEMMERGMRPNAATYTAVFEAFVREHKEDAARELLQEMKGKGFVPDEKAVREVVQTKRGQTFRTLINILFDKY